MRAGGRMMCPTCKAIIQSTHIHDFVACTCGGCFVDGGSHYLRYGTLKEGAAPPVPEPACVICEMPMGDSPHEDFGGREVHSACLRDGMNDKYPEPKEESEA